MQWDDEGYFLLAYHDFLSGRVLYDQVFSMYGPFTFWAAAATARFGPGNVTHDAFRWVLLFAWIAIAALMGATVWRWTKRPSLGLVVFLLAGSNLKGLAKGVGHPQTWIILAAAVLLYLGIDWISVPGKRWKAVSTGFLIALIVLCKINLGILTFLGVAIALCLQLRGRLARLSLAVLVTSAAALGVVLFLRAIIVAERYFALAYLGSLALVVGLALLQPVEHRLSSRSLLAFLAAFGLTICAGVGLTLALGTSAHALFRSLITEPALFVKSYHYPFWEAARKSSLLLAALGMGIAAAVAVKRRALQARPLPLGTLKVISGAALLCAFCYDHRLVLTASLLFLCLLIIEAPPNSGAAYSNRVLLASLSLLFSLQLFPMAGEQADWATLLPMMAAAIVLADGLDCIERENLALHLPRWNVVLARSTPFVLMAYLFLSVGTDALMRFKRWETARSLNLPGAHWLRLPPAESATLRDVVYQVNRDCKTVLMIPGIYSISLWSGVPPAEEKRFNTWPFLWPAEVENKELPDLRQSDRGCVLTSDSTYLFFKHFAVTKGNDELLSDVRNTMTPIASVQDFKIYQGSQGKN